jgi:hypothetical protein
MPNPIGINWFDAQQRKMAASLGAAVKARRKRKQDEADANATKDRRNEFDKVEFARNMGVTASANAARQSALGAARDVEATVQTATTQEGGDVSVDEGAGDPGSDNRRRRKARASGQTGVNI